MPWVCGVFRVARDRIHVFRAGPPDLTVDNCSCSFDNTCVSNLWLGTRGSMPTAFGLGWRRAVLPAGLTWLRFLPTCGLQAAAGGWACVAGKNKGRQRLCVAAQRRPKPLLFRLRIHSTLTPSLGFTALLGGARRTQRSRLAHFCNGRGAVRGACGDSSKPARLQPRAPA